MAGRGAVPGPRPRGAPGLRPRPRTTPWPWCEICRRLEGLPLAIELAAARTRLLDPEALLRRLEGSLDALGSGTVDMPERQQTLRATVEWSIGMLDDAERSLLETVAVFVDGWTVEAAAEVAGLDEDRALDLTEALARHSLLQPRRGRAAASVRGCSRRVRAFVAERLARPARRRRDPAPPRRPLPSPGRAGRPPAEGRWAMARGLERLQAEAGNLRAAVALVPRLTTVTPLPHLFRDPLALLVPCGTTSGETRAWVDRLLPAADSLEPPGSRGAGVDRARGRARTSARTQAALAARERLEPLLLAGPGPLPARGVTARPRRGPRRSRATSTAPCRSASAVAGFAARPGGALLDRPDVLARSAPLRCSRAARTTPCPI